MSDIRAKARIDIRVRRLALGKVGDVKPVGSGVSEMHIDYGPGFRVYYVERGSTIIVLLCGGDKRTQAAGGGIGDLSHDSQNDDMGCRRASGYA